MKNVVGQRFGRLVVIKELAPVVYKTKERPNGKAFRRVETLCDCGNTHEVVLQVLRKGTSSSCGCLKRAVVSARNHVHGGCGTPEHGVWRDMIKRCESPRYKHYAQYGGRGITVSPLWRHDFAAFYAHVGPRPSAKHSIDRIDTNGNYEPGNVQWSLPKPQQRNKQRNLYATDANGVRKTLAEWAEVLGVPYKTLWVRRARGHTDEEILRPLRGV